MDLMTKNYLDRAENELILAAAIKRLSDDAKAKEYFDIEQRFTFYSSAISHSYYSIFYSAVDTGLLDVKLLEIYKRLVIRADELLGIFQEEKKKRGDFTYKTIPQANQEPAEDSVRNARIFFSNIKRVIETMK